MPKRTGKQDFNQAVHAIFDNIAEGVSPDANGEAPAKQEREKDPAAVALGRRGGLKGGKSRMDGLTPKEKTELGKKAARARWGKPKSR